MPLRIGTVSYLNAAPVNEGLDAVRGVQLIRRVPSRLADMMRAGELDAALVPVFEALERPLYRIVPGISISCRGPVQSVHLFCKTEPSRIRSVALDPSSRASAALARILLNARCAEPPTYRIGIDPEADAQLVIGDPALRRLAQPRPEDACEMDLGEEWMRATGLPFVFAVWAVQPTAAAEAVAETLQEAKRRGQKRIQQIAQREAERRNLPEKLCRQYLMSRIEYDLDHDHAAGLKWFANLAAENGLIPAAPDIDRMILPPAGAP